MDLAHPQTSPREAIAAAARLATAMRPATPVLLVEQGGVRIGVRRRDVCASLPVTAADWPRLARMAEAGTFGRTGLPFARLARRLGIAADADAPREAVLLLVGSGGKARCVLLLDGVPFTASARIEPLQGHVLAAARKLPAGSGPFGSILPGLGVLPDGSLALVADPPAPPARAARSRATRHLLVQVGAETTCAIALSAVAGLERTGPQALRIAITTDLASRTIAAQAVIGVAGEGRVERREGRDYLAVGEGLFPLLARDTDARPAPRVLLVAPDGPVRATVRDLAHSLGYPVSLCDDARALHLAAGRFDLVVLDTDAHGAPPAGVAAPVIGIGRETEPGGCAVRVAPDDRPGLLAALIGAGCATRGNAVAPVWRAEEMDA
ncbi:hypothetical protein [Ancylobacter terrae]|uniref:hypothetical protein n=1 Tax=Ancylobacter sp. sgz301288 TaxID=3342077 RepID=UPI00385ACEF0